MIYDRVGARLWNEITAALRELPKERFRTKLRSFLSGLLLLNDSVLINAVIQQFKPRWVWKL